MVGPVGPLEDGQRSLVDRFRFGMAPLSVDEGGERREVGRHDGIVRPERPLPEFDRPPRPRFAARMVAPRVRQTAEIVQQRRQRDVVRAGGSFDDGDRSFVPRAPRQTCRCT